MDQASLEELRQLMLRRVWPKLEKKVAAAPKLSRRQLPRRNIR